MNSISDTINNLLTQRGSYRPSFYHIHLNTENALDRGCLTNVELSTLFHEYLHFLQDMTTLYGFISTCRIVDRIKVFCEMKANGTYDMSKPLSNQLDGNQVIIEQLYNLRIGGRPRSAISKVDFIKVEKNGLINGLEDIEYILVDGGNNNPFVFGSLCILESMASLFQRKFVPETNHPNFPYHTVELFIESMYPEFGSDSICIFSLCDVCLMTTDPGPSLYQAVLDMKVAGFVPKSGREVYDFVWKTFKFEDVQSGNKIELLPYFEWAGNNAKTQFSDYFTVDNFAVIKEACNSLFDNAIKLRKENPYFLIDIMEGDLEYAVTKYFELFNEIGTPLITNDKYECLLYNPHLEKNRTSYPQWFFDPGNTFNVFSLLVKSRKVAA